MTTLEQLREALAKLHADPHYTITHEGSPVGEMSLDVDPVKETVNLSIVKRL